MILRIILSQNAYVRIELNAYVLLTYLLTIRDQLKEQEAYFFLPWLLGSQSCEKTFQSATSMTIFSTINFGVLRCLHRLQIQATLQAELKLEFILNLKA